MDTIKIWNDNPSDRQLREVADRLERGEVIIVPTDTLYAIVCDSANPKAIERVCRIKGINPAKMTLSILCDGISMASEYARYDNYGYHIMRELTPGPYTFLFKAAPTLPRAFKGRKEVGVRIPACETCRRLAETLGRPLMSTSVHFETDDYAINPELIAEAYDGLTDLILLGEDGGLEHSTIIDCTGREAQLVREGKGEF